MKKFMAVLTRSKETDEGIYFGQLEVPGLVDMKNRPIPAQLVIPAQIYENHGKPDTVTVVFCFGEDKDLSGTEYSFPPGFRDEFLETV
jgi:hypothetical protein